MKTVHSKIGNNFYKVSKKIIRISLIFGKKSLELGTLIRFASKTTTRKNCGLDCKICNFLSSLTFDALECQLSDYWGLKISRRCLLVNFLLPAICTIIKDFFQKNSWNSVMKKWSISYKNKGGHRDCSSPQDLSRIVLSAHLFPKHIIYLWQQP